MRAINHAMTGALLAFAIEEPAAAIPAALISHFVCDVIPHHGFGKVSPQEKEAGFKRPWFRWSLIADSVLCIALVAVFAVYKPHLWLLASICAFAAAAPDLLWARRYVTVLRNSEWHPTAFDRFAGWIQWFERPIGGIIELIWFAACSVLLLPFLH